MNMEGLSEDQMNELKETFKVFDVDRSDSISSNELGNAMRSLGMNPTDDEINEMIREVDRDGNGKLEFDEFCEKMRPKIRESNPVGELTEAFRVFDKNGNGKIERDELANALKSVCKDMTDEEINEMFNLADVNNDGILDSNELAKALCGKKD